jgi:hypothetical protein
MTGFSDVPTDAKFSCWIDNPQKDFHQYSQFRVDQLNPQPTAAISMPEICPYSITASERKAAIQLA